MMLPQLVVFLALAAAAASVAPAPATLRLLPPSAAGAVCLDGSPPGYYFRPADPQRLLFHFLGQRRAGRRRVGCADCVAVWTVWLWLWGVWGLWLGLAVSEERSCVVCGCGSLLLTGCG